MFKKVILISSFVMSRSCAPLHDVPHPHSTCTPTLTSLLFTSHGDDHCDDLRSGATFGRLAESNTLTVCAFEEVMDDEGSLHQKSNDVCTTEDVESIDFLWFENTKLNRVKNGARCLLKVGVRDWASLGTSPSRTQGTVAEVMDAEVEREEKIHLSKRPRVAERVAIHVPPEVEPQNRDFDVNEFLQSSPNPVVAQSSGTPR